VQLVEIQEQELKELIEMQEQELEEQQLEEGQ